MNNSDYLTAAEAAARLGISPATLYAYVSRGLIRSVPADDGSRRHQYAAADVEAHRLRREHKRSPAVVAESVLDWGIPVLESSITLIENGRLYYRGYDATTLALNSTLEEVAGLIWSGALDGRHFAHTSVKLAGEWDADGNLTAMERFQKLLFIAAGSDPAAYDLRPDSIINSGAGIIKLFTHALCGISPAAGGISAALQEGWQLPREARKLINAALILCADHELNVSAFTARCIASAGSTPYAVVQGGLAALQGTRHGGYTERVEAFLREVGQPEEAQVVLAARLRRGESLPGFGHPLYPAGDPRARLLLQLVQENWGTTNTWILASSTAAAAAELLEVQPTIDFALVTMARSLALPPGSPLALFALGRTVGWIGHALEQYAAGNLIRPRARYIGLRPEKIGNR